MKTSTKTTTRNWIVNDLLRRKGITLSWEKTRKTSNSSTTNGLLNRMPDHINERHDIREFHQLFRCLRHGENRARAAGRRRHLGQGRRKLRATPPAGRPSAAQERREPGTPARHRRTGPRCAADPCPAAWPPRAGQAARRWALRTGWRAPAGVWGDPGSWPWSSTRAPTPRPWQSSVLLRSGVYSLPGPLRRSSAHVSAMSGAVAAVVAVQLQKRPARWGPFQQQVTQTRALFGTDSLCCCCWMVILF